MPAPSTSLAEPSTLSNLLRALRSRNYRLFFAGQLISLIGTWLTQVATSWLVYRITKSTLMLGIVSFAGQIPAFALAPFAGVLVDRWNLHKTLIVTQTLAMLQSLALAYFTLTGHITVWHILVLYLFQGLVNAVDIPARQSFIVQLVEKREDLSNAIALNSSMVNMARLIGPSLAGIIIAATNEGICFLIDGISYLAVIISLLAMHITRSPRKGAHNHVLDDLTAGIRYAFGFKPIRAPLLLLALVSLVGAPYSILMPVFATDILHGGPKTLGFLMAASGIGALAGALYLASRKSIIGMGKWIAGGAAGFGLGLILFAYSRSLALSIPMMAVTGFCMITAMASVNTVLQTITEDHMRGRVMALFTMCFMGMMPLGSLLAGELARPDRLGPSLTLALGGVTCILGGAFFARNLPAIRKLARPILVQRGILPEVAAAIHSTSEMRVPPEH
jgi:MFS family permease